MWEWPGVGSENPNSEEGIRTRGESDPVRVSKAFLGGVVQRRMLQPEWSEEMLF